MRGMRRGRGPADVHLHRKQRKRALHEIPRQPYKVVGREGGFECGCGRLRVQGRPSSESSSLQLLIAFKSKCSRSPSLDATVENEAGLGLGGRPLPRFVGEREGGAAGFRGLGWDGPYSSSAASPSSCARPSS